MGYSAVNYSTGTHFIRTSPSSAVKGFSRYIKEQLYSGILQEDIYTIKINQQYYIKTDSSSLFLLKQNSSVENSSVETQNLHPNDERRLFGWRFGTTDFWRFPQYHKTNK